MAKVVELDQDWQIQRTRRTIRNTSFSLSRFKP